MGIKFNRKMKSQGGQALVEFALAFTIFLLVVLGIIEFGRLLVAYSSVYTAAREAARYGAAVDASSGTPLYNDCAGIRAAARRVGFLGMIDDKDLANKVQISYDNLTNIDVTDPNLADLDADGTLDTFTSCPCLHNGKNEYVTSGSRIIVKVTTTFSFIVLNLPQITVTSTTYRSILKDIEINEQP